MKKNLLCYLTILMVAIVSIGFVSCSSDDKEDEVSIVGVWKYSFRTGYVIKQFNADRTGYSQEYDTEDGGWHRKHEFTYSYDEKQKKLYRMDTDGDKETYEVRELSATKLILVEMDTYGYSTEIETYIRQ